MFSELLVRIAAVLDELSIPYMVIGGQAVILHGDPRLTRDVDITIQSEHTRVPEIMQAAQARGFVSAVAEPLAFVKQTMVLVLADTQTGGRVDIVFGFTPYEQEAIARAVTVMVKDYPVRFARAEDLILHKLFASRPQDLLDVRGIMIRQRGRLDLIYIRRWLPRLAEVSEAPDLVKTFEEMLAKYGEP